MAERSDSLWGWTLKSSRLGRRQSSEDFNIQPAKSSLQINTRTRRHNSLFVFQHWYNWPKLLRLLIYYPVRRQLINSLTFVLPKTAKKKRAELLCSAQDSCKFTSNISYFTAVVVLRYILNAFASVYSVTGTKALVHCSKVWTHIKTQQLCFYSSLTWRDWRRPLCSYLLRGAPSVLAGNKVHQFHYNHPSKCVRVCACVRARVCDGVRGGEIVFDFQ